MILRLATLFCFLSGMSQAGPVIVSAGQHPNFARLIMSFDERPDWKVKRAARSYRISFATEENLAFDLSKVFRLIGRDWISDVRVVGDGLEIDIACDCEMVVSTSGSDSIVADVRPWPEQKPIAMDVVGNLDAPDESLPAPMPQSQADATERRAPTQLAVPERGQASFELPVQERPPLVDGLSFLLDRPSRSAAVDLVGREFSRAAAQGLVEPDPDIDQRRTPPPPGMESLAGRSNLAVTTGIDVALSPNKDNVAPTETGSVCIADSRVDVTAWGDATDVQGLGRIRSEAIAENGSVTPEGALALARYYLSLGFGAEAMRTALYIEPENRELILALGDVIDHGRSASPIFDGQVSCDGAIALWAALAKPIEDTETPLSTNHILSTFSALSPHLRAHLGPLLAERLHEAGQPSAARHAIHAVTRGGEKTLESQLATARLDLEGSEADTARDTLTDLSRGTDITAAEALLELLRDAEARDMPPNPNWVEEAPSLVRAIEGTDVAVNLNVAAMRGRVALGWFDKFRAAVVEDTPGLTPDVRSELSAYALTAAARVATDLDFVKTEIGLAHLAPPEALARDARFEVTNRLLAIGLVKRAKHYLPTPPETSEETAATARVLEANGMTESATSLLAVSPHPESRALLAEILARTGQDERALEIYASLERQDDALAAAIRTGNWNWIENRAIPDLSEAARQLVAAPQRQEPSGAPGNGELIDQSRSLREQVITLLNRTNPSIGEEAFTN